MSTGRIKTDTKLVRVTTDLKLLSGFKLGDAVVRHGKIPAAFIATPANLAASFVPAEETARTAIQIPLHSITNTTNNFVSTLPKHLAKSIKAVTTVTGSLSSLAIRGAKWFVQPLVQMAESFAYGTSFNMVFGGDSKTSDTKIKRDAQDRLDALHDNTIFEPGVGEDFDDIRETKTPEELLATLGFDLAGNWILGKKVDEVSPDIFENIHMHTLHHLNKAYDNPYEDIGVSGYGDMVMGCQAISYQVSELGINATDELKLTIKLMNEGLSHALKKQIDGEGDIAAWRQAEEILVKNIERAEHYIKKYAEAQYYADLEKAGF